jgi:hypothetical protein
MQVNGQLSAPVPLLPGKEHQEHIGRGGEEKEIPVPNEIRTPVTKHVTWSQHRLTYPDSPQYQDQEIYYEMRCENQTTLLNFTTE